MDQDKSLAANTSPTTDRKLSMRHLTRKRVAAVVAITAIFLLAVFWFISGRLVAACPLKIGPPPSDLRATSIELLSEAGATISGWHVRSEDGRGVVVLLHGIRGSRLGMLDRARMLNKHGYSTVLVDLQAHGESSGDTIMLGYREKFDVQAAVEYAKREHPGEKVAVIGCSLGGAAAVLASPLKIDALIIEAVYPTIEQAIENRVANTARLGALSGLPSWLLLVQLNWRLGITADQLRPIDRIDDIGCPVFVISGSEDRHTTAAETEQLFEAANQPKQLWLVEGAAHIDLFGFTPELYEAKVVGFIDKPE